MAEVLLLPSKVLTDVSMIGRIDHIQKLSMVLYWKGLGPMHFTPAGVAHTVPPAMTHPPATRELP